MRCCGGSSPFRSPCTSYWRPAATAPPDAFCRSAGGAPAGGHRNGRAAVRRRRPALDSRSAAPPSDPIASPPAAAPRVVPAPTPSRRTTGPCDGLPVALPHSCPSRPTGQRARPLTPARPTLEIPCTSLMPSGNATTCPSRSPCSSSAVPPSSSCHSCWSSADRWMPSSWWPPTRSPRHHCDRAARRCRSWCSRSSSSSGCSANRSYPRTSTRRCSGSSSGSSFRCPAARSATGRGPSTRSPCWPG